MRYKKWAAQKISKKLLPFREYIHKRINDGVTNCKKLEEELNEKGYSGTYMTLYRFLKLLPKRSINEKRSIRFETGPGEQAQVDWGYFGKIEINGKLERLYCFVYVLSYSRMKYIEFAVKQNLRTLVQCHIQAFEKLGIPKAIVYDNMKTVVVNRKRLPDGTTKIQLNATFLDFAKYYGFTVEPTAPYWPRSKGKVEACVKFVRYNFMQGIKVGKGLKSLEQINERAKQWLDTIANAKINKTTQERPRARWLKEKPFLYFPNKTPHYEILTFQPRFSTKDGEIEYKSCAYPIPQEYARKKISIKEISNNGLSTLEIYYEYELIAKYFLSPERHKWIKENEAIFFKSSPKKKIARKVYPKMNKTKIPYPTINHRPASYYNQVIPGRRIRRMSRIK